MNQWEDLRITQTLFQDRTLFCEGDADQFIEIIRKKRGSAGLQSERAAVQQKISDSQLFEQPE